MKEFICTECKVPCVLNNLYKPRRCPYGSIYDSNWRVGSFKERERVKRKLFNLNKRKYNVRTRKTEFY